MANLPTRTTADLAASHVADHNTLHAFHNLIDAVGDLIVGVGADAAGRLAKGSAQQTLRVNAAGTALEWASFGLLAVYQYNPATEAIYTTGSTTLVDVDATNAVITFTAPASGSVLHKARIAARNTNAAQAMEGGYRDASGIIAGSRQRVVGGSTVTGGLIAFLETGLTAGVSYTRRLAYCTDAAGTAEVRAGISANRGPLVMEVWAA